MTVADISSVASLAIRQTLNRLPLEVLLKLHPPHLLVADDVFVWDKRRNAPDLDIVAFRLRDNLRDLLSVFYRFDAASPANSWWRWEPVNWYWVLAMIARTSSAKANAADMVDR